MGSYVAFDCKSFVTNIARIWPLTYNIHNDDIRFEANYNFNIYATDIKYTERFNRIEFNVKNRKAFFVFFK